MRLFGDLISVCVVESYQIPVHFCTHTHTHTHTRMHARTHTLQVIPPDAGERLVSFLTDCTVCTSAYIRISHDIIMCRTLTVHVVVITHFYYSPCMGFITPTVTLSHRSKHPVNMAMDSPLPC